MKRLIRDRRGLWVIAGALLLLLLSLLLRRLSMPAHGGGRVDVYLDSALYESVPLGEDRTVVCEQADGVRNVIEVQNGRVFMRESTCAGQDCVKQGEVNCENCELRPLGGWIICLPNRVSVELVPNG